MRKKNNFFSIPIILIILVAIISATTALLYSSNTKDFFSSVISTTTPAFSDVNSNSPFYDAVDFVKLKGVVKGYEDGTYKPDNQVNRAEFIKIIIGAIFSENEISACTPTKTFSDVSSSDWFYQYVCMANTNGIVDGYTDGSFKPSNYISFSEASKIIVNAFGYETSPKEIWYQSFVEKLEEFKAIPSTVRLVSKNISRGEMAEMIYRLKEKIVTKTSTNFFTGNPKTVQTTTFLKSYRMKGNADTFGIVETQDGGYALTGSTWTPNELCGTSMFFIKADNDGNKQWKKLFHNCSSDGYAITQLTDGNLVAAGEVSGEFRTDEDQAELEGQGDNFLVGLDSNGNNTWTRTVSQQSTDRPAKLLPTNTGGFTMSGSTGTLVGQSDVADIQDVLSLGNFSANGETNWFKKIEGDEIMAKSINQTSDSGYVMIANIKLVEENDQKVPALVKLDKNGKFQWATGLENVPMEIPNLTMDPDGKKLIVGTPNKIHVGFGQFTDAEQTSDGGYIALGSYFSILSDAAIAQGLKEIYGQSTLVGIKVDSKGKLQWARSIKAKKFMENTSLKKTADGGYIIMGNSSAVDFADQQLSERNTTYNELMNAYNKKYPPGSPETPASKRDMEIIADTIAETESPFNAKHIILIKLDKNFNYQWGKNIGGTRDLDGYDIIQTTDSGYAIAGTWHTGIKYKLLGTWLEYTEAMILKLDTNGDLGNSDLVADFSDIELSDVSVYIVANSLSSPELIVDYPMENVSRTISITNKDGGNTTTAETMTYQAQICSETKTETFTGTGGTTPTTKTRAQMKYDETIAIEPTTAKGILVNDEVTPILKDVFKDVKLWDNDISGWVAYRFSRLVTKDDISKIETAMETLGYKLDKNDNGNFTAVKIGMTMNFSFYLGDTNTGRLDITY
jgi:hypothetical protein